MTIHSRILLSGVALVLAAASMPSAAPAQASPAPMKAGAAVKDTAGGEVGTIATVDGGFVNLKTDKHEVRLPATSFTAVEGGYIMAMTRAEVNAAVEKSIAEAEAAIKVGAIVKDPAGGEVGTIEAITADLVTVKLAKSAVQLPRSAFAATPAGPVIGNTAAELEAQVAAAAAAQPAQ